MSRLALPHERHLRRIVEYAKKSPHGSLFLAPCASEHTRRSVEGEIERRLGEGARVIRVETPENPGRIWDSLLEARKSGMDGCKSVLVLCGFSAGDRALDLLNLGRESWAEHRLHLLIWLDRLDHLDRFRARAPDLWSFRTGVTAFLGRQDFSPAEEARPTENLENELALRDGLIRRTRDVWEHADLLLAQARYLDEAGRMSESLDRLAKAERALRVLPADPKMRAALKGRLSERQLWVAGNLDMLQEALDILAAAPEQSAQDRNAAFWLSAASAPILDQGGWFSESRQVYDHALSLLEPGDLGNHMSLPLNRGNTLLRHGSFRSARALITQAQGLNAALELSPASSAYLHAHQGTLAREQGQSILCLSHLQSGISCGSRSSSWRVQAHLLEGTLQALFDIGLVEDALFTLDDIRKLPADPPWVARAYVALARLHHRVGDTNRAREILFEIKQRLSTYSARCRDQRLRHQAIKTLVEEVLDALAKVETGQDQVAVLAEAESLLRDTIVQDEQARLPELSGALSRPLARVLQRQGRLVQAIAEAELALVWARRFRGEGIWARILAEKALLHSESAELTSALACWEEAESIYQRTEVPLALERLQRERGKALWRALRFEEALAAFSSAEDLILGEGMVREHIELLIDRGELPSLEGSPEVQEASARRALSMARESELVDPEARALLAIVRNALDHKAITPQIRLQLAEARWITEFIGPQERLSEIITLEQA